MFVTFRKKKHMSKKHFQARFTSVQAALTILKPCRTVLEYPHHNASLHVVVVEYCFWVYNGEHSSARDTCCFCCFFCHHLQCNAMKQHNTQLNTAMVFICVPCWDVVHIFFQTRTYLWTEKVRKYLWAFFILSFIQLLTTQKTQKFKENIFQKQIILKCHHCFWTKMILVSSDF